jgi:MFS family permease
MRLFRRQQPQVAAAAQAGEPDIDPYKGRWSTLSNTTLGMLMATIDSSIVLISLPDIFRGIQLNPLTPGNTSYFLWMLMGYMLVTAVLVVSFGRLGDMFGRVRMYNLGGGSSYSPCSRSCCRSPGCTARPQPST